ADLDPDVPVHAHARPRFRGRSAPRSARRGRRPRRRPRVQVRLGARPRADGTRRRRRHAVGRGDRSIPHRSSRPPRGSLTRETGHACAPAVPVQFSAALTPRGWVTGAARGARMTAPQRRRLTMSSPLRARALRTLATLALLAGLLIPGSAPALGADGEPLILRAGTDQDLQVLNPWQSVVVADFEVFTLNYDTLVGFGQDIEPVPGFAESWEQSEDGLTWTFHIRPGMTWSDGQPATAEDARWTYQLILDAAETETGYLGQGYLDGYVTNAGVTSVEAPDEETLVITTEFPNTLLLQSYVPILPKHIWSQYTLEQIGDVSVNGYFKNEPPIVGTGPYQ